MPNTINYADKFDNKLRELYGQELTSDALYHSNLDIKVTGAKNIKIPTLSVSGYKDHSRSSLSFNTGSYENDYEDKTLDHDRDIEFGVDPMDVDETNSVLAVANIHSRFEKTQAIPELDCYTYSKIYSEFVRVGGTVKTTALTAANVLSDFDDDLVALEDAGVPLDRVILFCTAAYKKLLKQSSDIQRAWNVNSNNGAINRTVHTIDDITKIVTVPSARFKTKFDFTDGCVPATGSGTAAAKNIQYILIDPECQVSRVKYSYIHFFAPGTDSRTADKYLYQNRRYNGTFAIDYLMKQGCIIHTDA
ncbi:MAG: capsid protein [Ruminococcus sp.]|nr:capsid protein [Ruminococcus sp.]